VLVTEPGTSKLYAISIPSGSRKTLSDRIGWATAVAANERDILVASGGKIMFLSGLTGAGENPPATVRDLRFKQISGLILDSAGELWVADRDARLIRGPISLR